MPGAANHDVPVRETVLVVEDDSRMRQLTIKRLKLIGYRVLEASDGPAALEILKRGDDVDLVFTDLIMPGGLSGREVAIRALPTEAWGRGSSHFRIRGRTRAW